MEAVATRLRDRHGLRVWFDGWELRSGPLHKACEEGIARSRFVAIVCSRAALQSDWVEAERQMAYARDPLGRHVLPVLLEDVDVPPGLASLLYFDLRDPAQDEARVAQLAAAIGAPAVPPAGASQRQPAPRGAVGAFPGAPVHQFHGRARELYDLEQVFRGHRAVLLHAMGGMGKTALAREAAYWWTRTGLFEDGACFLSFEQGATPERVAQALGTYLEGPSFESRPQAEQLARARDLFGQKRVLMVWDNFESVLPQFDEHKDSPLSSSAVLPALADLFDEWTEDAGGHGRLLVTCRPAQTPLKRARAFELHGLDRPDSLYLLFRVVQKAGAEPEAFARADLDALLQTLADHPLSIELVGPHLKDMAPLAVVTRFGELLARSAGDPEAERNRSLLASLRFSTDRLSPAARAALPWLGLFRVGVFEDNLLDVSQIASHEWDGIRAELEATALVRVESEWQVGDRPYLRFHPTLPWAAAVVARDPATAGDGAPAVGAGVAEVRARYVPVYAALDMLLRTGLRGPQARGAMEVMAREEANFRAAVEWAAADGSFGVAAPMGDTFGVYLQMCNRQRARARWAAWLAEAARLGEWSEAAAGAERDAAWALCTQGHAAEAVPRLEALIERLRATAEFEPAFELAAAKAQLGRTLDESGATARAIPILRDALRDWERLCGEAGAGALARGGESSGPATSPSAQAAPPTAEQATRLGNLASALGDLANALRAAGHLDEALATADWALAVQRQLRRERDVAAGLGQTGAILVQQGRYAEAVNRYRQALDTARRCGDRELEAAGLQHLGVVAKDQRQYGRATGALKQALRLFQEAGDDNGVMQTCNLLGIVEQQQGRLGEARAWHERSREIAERRGDTKALGSAAQCLGIVCQREGEQATERGDTAAARHHFAEAEAFVRESLRLDLERRDEPGQAASHGQLGRIYVLMGDIERAHDHAQRAREIRERLGDLRGLSITYLTLKNIARARGDAEQAAHWEAREAAVDAELARRAVGGDGPPPQLRDALAALAAACVQAASHGSSLPADAQQALDQLDSPQTGPLQPLGAYLRRLASTPPGQLVATLAVPPDGLPAPLARVFARLHEQVQQARLGP